MEKLSEITKQIPQDRGITQEEFKKTFKDLEQLLECFGVICWSNGVKANSPKNPCFNDWWQQNKKDFI